MARTVGDVALGYHLLSAPDGVDGYAVHDSAVDAPAPRIAGQPLRVGWVSEAAYGPVDPEITAAVADASLPALSVPHAFSSEGLPIGIQLAARWFGASTILRLGALLERRGGLGDRRPPLTPS